MTPTPHSFHNQVQGPGPAAVLASGDLRATGNERVWSVHLELRLAEWASAAEHPSHAGHHPGRREQDLDRQM